MTGAEADDSEALRAALGMKLDTALDEARDTSIYRWPQQQDVGRILDHLLPLVLAYGREQATRGAEQALRVAQMAADSEGDAARGQDRDAWIFFRDWLANRADDLGRQT